MSHSCFRRLAAATRLAVFVPFTMVAAAGAARAADPSLTGRVLDQLGIDLRPDEQRPMSYGSPSGLPPDRELRAAGGGRRERSQGRGQP